MRSIYEAGKPNKPSEALSVQEPGDHPEMEGVGLFGQLVYQLGKSLTAIGFQLETTRREGTPDEDDFIPEDPSSIPGDDHS